MVFFALWRKKNKAGFVSLSICSVQKIEKVEKL